MTGRLRCDTDGCGWSATLRRNLANLIILLVGPLHAVGLGMAQAVDRESVEWYFDWLSEARHKNRPPVPGVEPAASSLASKRKLEDIQERQGDNRARPGDVEEILRLTASIDRARPRRFTGP